MKDAPPAPTLGTRILRSCRRHYLLTLWLPTVATLLVLAAAFNPYSTDNGTLRNIFGAAYLVGLLYLLVSTIVRFYKKRIAPAVANLLCLLAAAAAIVPALMVAMFISMLTPDDFAKGLVIPAGIDIAEPGFDASPDFDLASSPDPFQAALLNALTSPPPPGDITLDLPSLTTLQRDHPDLLARFLASSPAWRVYTRRGNRHATRRWRSGGAWRPRGNLYYSSFTTSGGPDFQSRTSIGLDGKPWGGSPQIIPPGTPTPVSLDTGNSMRESHVGIRTAGLLVEQFEQSSSTSRPVTTTAFTHLESEFAALAAEPTWGHAKTLLPPDAVTTDAPSITLSGSAGTYNAHIRCNPGEPGSI
ncbi:MAG: hypothetical protein P8J87_06005, partial [Verrucomicrobiales bacterium]|nr:hypothetical protein [Verrucomicrobiales bacterium]